MSGSVRRAAAAELTVLRVGPADADEVVETLRSALDCPVEVLAGDPSEEPDADCLLVDGTSDVDPDRLVAHRAPVALHVDDPDDVPSPLLEAADTVVEVSGDESRRVYCERVRNLVTGADPGDSALGAALDRADGPLGGASAYYLVGPDGTVEWASAPLGTVLPGSDAAEGPPSEAESDATSEAAGGSDGGDGDGGDAGDGAGGFDERLAAAVGSVPGALRYVEREASGLARYLSLPVDGETRHYRLETHRPDGLAERRRLEVVREVTGHVGLVDRLGTFESLVEGAQDGLYTLDETGTIDFCNDSFAAMLGYEPVELVGEHAGTLLTSGEFERAREAVDRLRENPDLGTLTVDATCKHCDGSLIDVFFHFSVLRTAGGVFDGIAGMARDVTDRKARERELERYETLVNAATDPMFAVGPDGRFTLVNDAFLAATGMDRETIIGAGPSVLVEEGAAGSGAVETWQRAYSDLMSGEDRQREHEFDVGAAFGEARTFEGRLVRFADDGSTLNIFRDVTDRVARETELRAVRDRMELALEAADAVVWNREVGTDEVTYYPDSAGLYGDAVATFRDFIAQVHPEDRDAVRGAINEATETVGEYGVEFRTERDGEVRWRAARGRVETDDDGDPVTLYGVTRDITDRKERERELERANSRYRTLVNNFPDGAVFLFDEDLRYTLAGGAGLEPLDPTHEDFEGATPHELLPDDVADELAHYYRQALDGIENSFDQSYRGLHYHVRTLPVRDEAGEVVAGMVVARDITERMERQRQLRRERDKLARLETVVASVQPLTETLTGATTRAQLESELCERLADSAAYTGAWVGDAHADGGAERPRATAGLPDDWVASTPDGGDPVARAVRTGEPQVVDHAGEAGAGDGEGHGDAVADADGDAQPRSVVVVPLVYRSTTHGVLAVGHADPEAVTDRELSVLSGLGRRVGQAVTAIENRRLLRGDRTVELRFDETPPTTPFAQVATAQDCTLELNDIVRVGEETSLFHAGVEGADGEAVAEALAEVDGVEFARALGNGEADRVQCRHASRCPFAVLIDHGGTVRRGRFSPAGTTVVADFAHGADTAAVADAVSATCPAFELVSKRDRERDGTGEQPSLRTDEPRVWDRLTDRQQEVVSAAYHAGYYDWPRGTTAEDLADALEVSAPTLHQHVRKVHDRLVGALVEGTAVFDART